MTPQDESESDGTDIELSLPVETVCYIIAKAREFDAKDAATDAGSSPLDEEDLSAAALEDRPSDPVEEELTTLISDLSEDAQIDLVTLTWLGRDDGSEEDWESLHESAAEAHNEFTANYLCGNPLLSDHLSAGLAVLGFDCADFFRGHM